VVVNGKRALVVGAGGVGRAIAAALAAEGAATLRLFDVDTGSARALATRLNAHYPALAVTTDSRDPAGMDIVVNATPLGMSASDPLPVDVERIAPGSFVGEVVMKQLITPLLKAAQARGCTTQVGTDMLFEQIPLYLAYFGFPAATAAGLRAVARLDG
jgi:shikimate dehydrogenase